MKKIILLAVSCTASIFASAQIYIGESGKTIISFYSHTVVEDISAKNTTVKPVLNAATGAFAVEVGIKGFQFKSGLMQEHFNENYMESDKIPYAKLTGKINEKIDYSKDGTYKITMTCKLSVHGVELPRNLEGTLTIKGGEVVIDSKFNVAMKDHNIKIPEAVGNKFAEAMEVTVKAFLKKKA